MNASLIIMAAGLGSRYGGIKQLAPVDQSGHIIMDYSIHDAIAAGFEKIVIVLRRDIEADFRRVIGERIGAVCRDRGVELAYAFQSMEALPEGFAVPPGRTKPWGTGQAVLAAREHIREPFAVINADDHYGRQSLCRVGEFLASDPGENRFCMAGFVLENTLSEFGGVIRGICHVTRDGELKEIRETPDILRTPEGIFAGGKRLCPKTPVSMNLWGLTEGFFPVLEEGFRAFLEQEVPRDPRKAEFLLPVFIGGLLEKQQISVKVLNTGDRWFGVTYQQDREAVAENFGRLIADGVYRKELYSDL